MKALPSIQSRLARALLAWSLAWGVAVTLAVGLAAQGEVNELLDDTLRASAEVMAGLLVPQDDAMAMAGGPVLAASAEGAAGHYAWQVVGPDARVLRRSARSPATALHTTPAAGFRDTPDWHSFGVALGSSGRMLYVAQSRAERHEAQIEVAISTTGAALAIGLLGHVWLRARVRHELAPLHTLSNRLLQHDPTRAGAGLGEAEREELAPMQAAIDDLGQRLTRRLARERAFNAHAAHSLRTPLAGLDAQLAVALRESPPAVQPRIQRARDAASRLQRVVSAMLALFRTDAEPQRQPVDLRELLAGLPVEGLQVRMQDPAAGSAQVSADPDLLAAALLNLLDNALQHGAKRITVSVPRADTVRLADDGPGISADQRNALRAALAEPDQSAPDQPERESGGLGLGLLLAHLVARSHGGGLVLPDDATGFTAELRLGARGGLASETPRPPPGSA